MTSSPISVSPSLPRPPRPVSGDRPLVRSLTSLATIGALAGGALFLVGCEDRAGSTSSTPASSSEHRVAAPEGAATASTHAKEELPWKHDAWDAALAEAKQQNRPVVVDLWAPWCHTCISMQKTVLTEPTILAKRDEFVWLALDTDRPENAAAMKNIPISFWPTFYVFAPDGATLARHVGGASAAQFVAFLEEGKAAHTGGADASLAALAEGDKAIAAGDAGAAAAAFERALAAGGPAWERRFAVRVELGEALHKAGKDAECLEKGLAWFEDMGKAKSASAADFVYVVGECAEAAPGEKADQWKKMALGPTSPILQVLADPAAALSADDRSDALRILRELSDAAGDKEKARAYAKEQQKVLDDAVAGLTDLELLAGYAWPREEVYVYLGEGQKLVAELERLVKALPGQYDPPYRLAWLYKEIGRADDAVAPAELALASVYGPRKVRAFFLLAGIQEDRGDVGGQKKAWQGVLDTVATLDDPTRYESMAQKAREKLAALGS